MLTILYSDSALAVCIKPAGILSQDAGETSMPQLLKTALGMDKIWPVHRLDREAGGLMVYALNEKAAASLCQAIQDGKMEKHYLALLSGMPVQEQGTLDDLLYHDKVRNKTYVVKRQRKGVKPAQLEYQILQQFPEANISLVKVHLLTGRTHQIRVQFASRKLPLVGDGKYGGGNGKLGLWSYQLCFPHPVTGETLRFHCSPPEAEPWIRFAFL